MRPDRCKKCNQAVAWIKMSSGKYMILEAKVLTVVTQDGKIVKGREPHWAHCPYANEFRKKKNA